MQPITLPHSNVRITFSPEFSREGLADLTRELLVNADRAREVRTNPVRELAKLGVQVDAQDLSRITDEDILQGMGLRAKAGAEERVHPGLILLCVVVYFIK